MNSSDTVYKYIFNNNRDHLDQPVLYTKDEEGIFQNISYGEMFHRVRKIGSTLLSLGYSRGDHIGLISDNRQEWLLSDLAMLAAGIIDVPRGCDSSEKELSFILGHSECRAAFIENPEQLQKLILEKEKLPLLQHIFLISGDKPKESPFKIYTWKELMDRDSRDFEQKFDEEAKKGCSDDVATVIYTSGTTGEPKGVVLSNRSFLFQIDTTVKYVPFSRGDGVISVLPSWHAFERAIEYIIFSKGARMAYSKPIGSILLPDFQAFNPHWMASVPRIWEAVQTAIHRKVSRGSIINRIFFRGAMAAGTVFKQALYRLRNGIPEFEKRSRPKEILISLPVMILLSPLALLGNLLVFRKIKRKLGKNFIAGISGGGALPEYVDKFYATVGITVLEGYGLTEAGPILSVRKRANPVLGTIGPLLQGVEHRIITQDGTDALPGEQGTLFIRSPQIMEGYYRHPEKTEEVLDSEGWLNTGDLAKKTYNDEFKILGRTKETIVLMGGENIEPVPIEESVSQSHYIDQVMIVGQDRRFLGAIVVPDFEILTEWMEERSIAVTSPGEIIASKDVIDLLYKEIQTHVNCQKGFKNFERIFRIHILPEKFQIGEEITQTLKLRRNIIYKKYEKQIDALFSS